ncbi:MAG: hypothetical protein CMJ65_05950 [Planctomycetaceae bacterium]|nr:hypothetical protein [Planctomycetaceae bacterium]MDP7274046.1 DUF1501 domain-containing protein [Planctomycetaceae bacterium]
MLDLSLGGWTRNCQGLTRRNVLRIGTLTAGGMTLGESLRSRAAAAEKRRPGNKRSVICFWLDGGPTHMETYDPKPEAPAEYRGPFSAVQTRVPGIRIGAKYPRQAQVADKMSFIRSVHHNNGDHFAAAHWMWTGFHGSNAANQDPQFPSIGAIASKVKGPNRRGLPAFVAIPNAATIGLRPGYQSGAYLGVTTNPFDAGSDPNAKNFQVRNLNLPGGIDNKRIRSRQGLLAGLDRTRREADSSGLMTGIDRFNQEAFDLITGASARKAFDISLEAPRLRDQYGRNSVGQGALLARRLVETGVTFVTVHSGGWDNHSGIEGAMNSHGPRMDAAISSLVSDLDQRGMLDEVIVMVMGEFGRTPRINGNAGRDHWGNAISVMLAGGGIHGGRVVGATDDKGTRPILRAIKPAHVLHTVYRQLGIDTTLRFLNHAGRPIPILDEGGPLDELI